MQLRLTGRWLDPAAADQEELLVVQIEGRRHRFPGTREEQVSEVAGTDVAGARALGACVGGQLHPARLGRAAPRRVRPPCGWAVP